MPTASAAKLEKQGSLDANDPLRQGIVMVDHKIRNLEKRKVKLDGYRDLQKSGKDLNSDQLDAISKYDAVIQQLEFAKELSKHLSTLASDAVKNAKKQARKESQEKAQLDLQRTKDMLLIQDVLSSMGQDNVREDFLQGKAKVTLSAEELQHIDDLYIELTPKREELIIFQDMFQGPAEVMSFLLEGKNKEVAGTTYTALKTKLFEIAKSGYFDNAQPEPEPVIIEEQVQEAPPVVSTQVEPPPVISSSGHVNQIQAVAQPPVPAHIPVPQPHVPVPQQTVVHPAQVPDHQVPVVPQPEEIGIPAASIETAYYTPSHLRVFQSGTIDFMQENEIDAPEQVEAAPSIPTMTYTNQSYTPTSQSYETTGQPPQQAAAPPPQPEPQIYHVNNTEVEDDQGWSHVGNDTHHQPPPTQTIESNDNWDDEPAGSGGNVIVEDSWATQSESQWNEPQHNNDGFITQGGRGRGGRGGRGGGDRDRNQKGGNYNSGGSRGRDGGRGGRGGYNREGGGGYNREGGYNRDREGGGGYGGGGNYKDQNSYQNGYQNRSDRGGRGRGGLSNDRQGGGGRGRGGGGGGRGGGYRGGNSGGGYRQQQQQQM